MLKSKVCTLCKSVSEGNGNPHQYSCLENSMDRGVWWAMVHGVTKSQTQVKQLSTHTTQGKFRIVYEVPPTE